MLDRIHECNVLISESWLRESDAAFGWEEWRNKTKRSKVEFQPPAKSIVDFRYFYHAHVALSPNPRERRFSAVGRLLLGLIRHDFSVPRLWNIRGNERVNPLPRDKFFQSLAISSPTLRILEACLGGRSEENRLIPAHTSLFGLNDNEEILGLDYDPPLLVGIDDLFHAIVAAQDILKEHQLSVSGNQPRQLIPFRLSDFSLGEAAGNDEEAQDAE